MDKYTMLKVINGMSDKIEHLEAKYYSLLEYIDEIREEFNKYKVEQQ